MPKPSPRPHQLLVEPPPQAQVNQPLFQPQVRADTEVTRDFATAVPVRMAGDQECIHAWVDVFQESATICAPTRPEAVTLTRLYMYRSPEFFLTTSQPRTADELLLEEMEGVRYLLSSSEEKERRQQELLRSVESHRQDNFRRKQEKLQQEKEREDEEMRQRNSQR